MVLRASLSIRHPGCLTETLTEGRVAVQITGDADTDVVYMTAPTAQAVEEYLASPRRRELVDVMSRTPTSVLFRLRHAPGGVARAIGEGGGSILWPAVYRDGREFYEVVVPSKAALKDVVARVGAIAEVAVESVADVPAEDLRLAASVSDLVGGLTDRQLAALLTAVEHGYYDTPRRVETDALAEAMGVSPSTFKEHVRKAEAYVLGRVARTLRAHEALRRSTPERGSAVRRATKKR